MRLSENDLALVLDELGLPQAHLPVMRAVLSGPDDGSAVSGILASEAGSSVSRRQLQRYLSDLGETGVVDRLGSGPRVRYRPNRKAIARAYLATDYLRRTTKPYDPERLAAYEPNRSRLLSSGAADEMRQLSDTVIATGATINQVVFRRIMIDISWASSRLEGNTYTIGETAELLEEDREAPGRTPDEARMIRNHARAVDMVVNNARDLEISPHALPGLHALLSRGLLADASQEGRVRQGIVQIGRSSYVPLSDPHRLTEELGTLTRKAAEITEPYERAFFLLLMVPYLQPFIDVNKRVGRIGANIPLVAGGLCPLTYVGMDESAYIDGLMSFYELGDSSLMEEAVCQAYREDVERFRTYLEGLSGRGDVRQDHSDLIDRLLRDMLRGVARGRIDPEDWQEFVRQAMPRELDAATRDAVLLELRDGMLALDEARAMGLGVKPSDYRAWQQRFDARS